MIALSALPYLLLPLAIQGPQTPSNPQRMPPVQDLGDAYLVNFDETAGDEGLTLEAFVKTCQDATGMNFTYSKETAQMLGSLRVRMFGSKRIPKDDFYNFFQIMMIINDFVCIKVGPDHLMVILIASLTGQGRNTLRQDAVYVSPDDLDRWADQPAALITTVIDLPHTDVRTLSNSMRTMFTDANTQQIIPVGNSNSLIITGFGSSVASIVKMLKFVDQASSSTSALVPEFEVIPLEFASAEEIAETVQDLLEASRRAVQSRGQQQAQQGVTGQIPTGQDDIKILVQPSTNSLLIMAMATDMPRIKELVARLDVELVKSERTYHIYALDNVDAEDLSKVLEDFIQDASRISPSTTGAVGGRPNPQAGGGGSNSASRNEIVVVPDKTTNSLLIAANRSRYDEVLDLIRRLDRRQPQVLIETALVELSGSNFLDLGIELGGADLPGSGTGEFGVTNFGLSRFLDMDNDGVPDVKVPNLGQGVTAGILNGSDFNLPVLLSALKTRRDTNVLNVPSVLVNNNGSAKVTSKDQQPTTTVTAATVGAGQTQESFNQYVEAGITLQISPTISASHYLRLKVALEVSTFLGAVSGNIPPPKITRTIDTTINVPDGDTMVIGGIVTDNKSFTQNSTPWLGDLPILGFLFRRTTDNLNRTTLYFFVSPHILSDNDFADLSEISYKKKLEAADTIGADRIRVIDPTFGKKSEGVNLRGFEVPLYRSPARGEVQPESVGLDAGRVHGLLRTDAAKPDASDKGTATSNDRPQDEPKKP